MISLENIRYYVNWWVANQRLELLCQTDNEQSRLGEHFENTFHYCQSCYHLINYPQKYSNIRGVEIEYNCEKLMANEMARIGGIWPMRRRTCGPITGWIWLRYSQLIFSTEWQLQAAALCGTSIFSSPDATIRVDRLLIPANQRPREASEQSQVANKKSVGVWTGNYKTSCPHVMTLVWCWSVSAGESPSGHYPAQSREDKLME